MRYTDEFPLKVMKLVISIFLLFFMTNLVAQNPRDAAKHIGAGVVIGVAGGYAADKITNGQRGWKWAGAVGSSFAAGLAKETFYDKPRGNEWEAKDVLYTTLGGVLSGMALDILTSNSRRRSGNGKKCGCLVAKLDFNQELDLPIFVENGTGDITSELQAVYMLK
jgi:hypothetical protein